MRPIGTFKPLPRPSSSSESVCPQSDTARKPAPIACARRHPFPTPGSNSRRNPDISHQPLAGDPAGRPRRAGRRGAGCGSGNPAPAQRQECASPAQAIWRVDWQREAFKSVTGTWRPSGWFPVNGHPHGGYLRKRNLSVDGCQNLLEWELGKALMNRVPAGPLRGEGQSRLAIRGRRSRN